MNTSIIEKQLEIYGVNRYRLLDVPNREVYVLYAVDDNDELVPTGLPLVIEIKDRKAERLDLEKSFKMIEDYG